MPFTDAERSFLTSTHLGRIATASASGEPDAAVVTFLVHANGDIEITGMDNTRTRKYHNVKANPRASFVVDDLASVDPWQPRGVKVTGAVRIGEDARGRPSLVVAPETVWSWGINDDADTVFGPIEKRSA
jgi:pyridoxamine 5'-phosphate oxidase family protein